MNWTVFALALLALVSTTALCLSVYIAQDFWQGRELNRKITAWALFAAFIVGASTWAGIVAPHTP